MLEELHELVAVFLAGLKKAQHRQRASATHYTDSI
jgi:hypothetical protein